MIALLLLLACASEPPDPIRQSLDAYTEGRAQLASGRDARAAESFRRALAANPQAAEVQLWLGRTLARQGDLEGAIAAATAALELRGAWGIAHYNRACWRARAGALQLAAADLAVALDDPSLDRLAVAADPDLDPLRADPRYRDQVPARSLPASIEVDSEPLFLGAEWTLRFTVQLHPGDALGLSLADAAAPPPAALRWVKAVEDRQRDGALESRTLTLSFRVEGAGTGAIGPFNLDAGGLSAQVGPAPYTLLALEGQPPPAPGATLNPFRSPQALLGALETGATRSGDELRIRAEPGDRITLSPARPAVKLEGRRRGQPQWIGRLVHSPEPLTIQISRGGAEVFSETL